MFAVKIFKQSNPRSQMTCVVKHLAGSESGSVQILKMFTLEEVMSFKTTKELNTFLNKGGNEEWGVSAMNRPKVYFTRVTVLVYDQESFWCQAVIWPEGDEDKKTLFKGPKRTSKEEATKAFWYLWNHGQHPYKTEEGMSARLVRLNSGYEEVVV